MIRAYKYVFYKLYRFERALFDPAPEYTALGLMILAQGMNIGFVLGLVNYYAGARIVRHFSKLEIFSFIALLALPQYWVLVHRGRFKQIGEQFRDETRGGSVVGGAIVGLYIGLSFIFLLWSLRLGVVP